MSPRLRARRPPAAAAETVSNVYVPQASIESYKHECCDRGVDPSKPSKQRAWSLIIKTHANTARLAIAGAGAAPPPRRLPMFGHRSLHSKRFYAGLHDVPPLIHITFMFGNDGGSQDGGRGAGDREAEYTWALRPGAGVRHRGNRCKEQPMG